MFPSRHIILGLIFSLIIFWIYPSVGLVGFFLIFSSSFLIDVDHYIYYVFKEKNHSLKKAYHWFVNKHRIFLSLSRSQRNKIYSGIFILHGIEILIALFLLYTFVSKYFLFIFMGFAFHLILDSIEQPIYWDRINKFSLIYDFKKSKNRFY